MTINAASKALFLQVGTGTMAGNSYLDGGTPTNNPTIDVVTAAVPAATIGNATAVAMTSTAPLTSSYDNFVFCSANTVYVGGFHRQPAAAATTATAVLSVTAPPTLTNVGIFLLWVCPQEVIPCNCCPTAFHCRGALSKRCSTLRWKFVIPRTYSFR